MAFRENLPGRVYNVNYINGQPKLLKKYRFNLIVIHYSLLALKFNDPTRLMSLGGEIKLLKGYKIAFPQDEYINSFYLNKFFREIRLDHLYTCLIEKKDIDSVYPYKDTGVSKISTVLTGYVNDKRLKPENKIISFEKRKIDIAYRARKNPYWLGIFSLNKWQIAEVFLKAKRNHQIFDISTKTKDTITGKYWLDFIENSRYMIGVEGGASLNDPKGIIREKVEVYLRVNPSATFDQVSKLFFNKVDNNIKCYALSPRIFEAISVKTCLILMEGHYNGILIPNKHYIPLKKDYSNLVEILDNLDDFNKAKTISNNAYNDIVLSKIYNYKTFIKSVYKSNKGNFNSKSEYYYTLSLYVYWTTFIHRIKEYLIYFFRIMKLEKMT